MMTYATHLIFWLRTSMKLLTMSSSHKTTPTFTIIMDYIVQEYVADAVSGLWNPDLRSNFLIQASPKRFLLD